MKNLIIAFCSIKPKQYSDENNILREKEYFNSLRQLFRIVPSNFDVIIVDNTLDNLEQLDQNFKHLISTKKVVLINNNIGSVNKGVGEINMLKSGLDSVDYLSYDKIVYLTARHIFTCPYFFERTNSLQKSVLISNPDFFYIKTGELVQSAKNGLYNDMVFSMKSKVMYDYVLYTNLDRMMKYGIGSEQNLYNFIKENNIDFEYIEHIGLIRNDWQKTGQYVNYDNLHLC